MGFVRDCEHLARAEHQRQRGEVRAVARTRCVPGAASAGGADVLTLFDFRFNLMRFKTCPKCGLSTTKCGCGEVIMCNGMDKYVSSIASKSRQLDCNQAYSINRIYSRCPNERCDHMKCPMCKVRQLQEMDSIFFFYLLLS